MDEKFIIRAKELVSKMTLAEKCSQLRYEAPAIERLGVPAYNWWNEALHGVARSGVATVFPQAIAAAASFDCELLGQAASAVSTEGRAKFNEYRKLTGDTYIYEGLTFWSPNINIFRDPRWGRGHETYGEDPFLTAVMGEAFVRGIQGTLDGDAKSSYRKADATLKHYAVHSGPESGRSGFDSKVSVADLYGTYLRAFCRIIENADPSAVMGAYNSVTVEERGVEKEPCCASKFLLGDILYGEFGFAGYVVSDCGAISNIHHFHKYTSDAAHSSAIAVKNGCTLNCGSAYAALLAAVDAKLIDEDDITAAAERLFAARYHLGMFADDCEYDNIPYDEVDCDAHRELNLRFARETPVLLKNNGVLPLDANSGKTIAVIGPNARDLSVLEGNYNGTPSRPVTIVDGIRALYNGRVLFTPGSHPWRTNDPHSCGEQLLHDAMVMARHADQIILVCGLNPTMEGEEGDAYNGAASGDKLSLELPDGQKQLYGEIMKIAKADGKPVIFINVSGSAINLTEQDRECDAVLQVFYPGEQGGRAVGEIIFGATNPSGRLPVTFYHSVDELPPFENYAMDGRTYRYFNGTPLYPFGYGLSYTDFAYSNLTAGEKFEAGKPLELSVTVANTGRYDGNEVVQAYVSYADVEHAPIKELAAFTRVTLGVGESKTVTLTLTADTLGLYGSDGKYFYPDAPLTVSVGCLKLKIK